MKSEMPGRSSKAWVYVGLALVLLVAGTVPALAVDTDQICIYQHESFGGASKCYAVGDEDTNFTQSTLSGSTSWNDQVSSIKVGFNTKVICYEHTDFKGASITLQYDACNNTNPTWSKMPKGWNDRVSSIKVVACDHPVNLPDVSSNQVIFFEHRDYGGRELSYSGPQDVADLTKVTTNLSGSETWNDRISSIVIGSQVKVVFYEHVRGTGQDGGASATSTVNIPCLVSIGWNDKMSGFKILPR